MVINDTRYDQDIIESQILTLDSIGDNSWKLDSQLSNHSNLTPFFVNLVKGRAILENPLINFL